ncbi:hypothetical protein GCM10023187_12030 [Nibrella viscosa]|uniref:SpaA-like prealbumin fold domain-containing protein n=1 Tax=Nibrella viscosa TaxID=1084524 RepID=A0ABP8K3F7_9BACT
MKIKHFFRLASLLSLSVLLFERCQPAQELTPGSTPDHSSARVANTAYTKTIGAYEITFKGATYNEEQSTWTYSVKRTGPAKGNGLSHLIFSLGECASFSNVVASTVNGVSWMDKTLNSEGSGTGCAPTGVFLKLNSLPAQLSDGNAYDVSFTLNVAVDPAVGTSWVKFGNNCQSGTMITPGCYHISGHVSKNECVSGTPTESNYANVTVQLANGGTKTVTTGANGSYSFDDVKPGSYTITLTGLPESYVVNPENYVVTTGPTSSEGNDFVVETFTTCGATCIKTVAQFPASWGPITIGNYTYTQEEAEAIINSSDPATNLTRTAFTDLVRIQLSGLSISGYTAVINWFNARPKVTAANIPANKDVTVNPQMAALKNYVKQNSCTE